jgi:crotonobetainyl-CoA:carnitine CoA-transferase CaiB-like acyl-CoA transferase
MRVLDGVRVLELGALITAPLAGMMLADLGADVIKVENPAGGDSFRAFRGKHYSPRFAAYNRNKRSIALDLTGSEGRRALLELVDDSDVLIENFRPGVMERLGLAHDVLHERNRRLIHCSITGFGASGPYKQRPAFDAVGLAVSGIASLLLDPERPELMGPTITDNVTGMYACYGILGALYERERSGRGRFVEVNMLEASIAFMPDAFANAMNGGLTVDRLTRVAASQSLAFTCGDGKLIALQLSTQEKFWLGLLAAASPTELASDTRFQTRDGRVQNYVALREGLRAVFCAQPRAYWEAALEANDVPFAPVHEITDVADDPQVQALGTFYEMHHPREGRMIGIRRPVRIDGDRTGLERPAPALGEHTDEILEESRMRSTGPAERE